MSPCVHVSVSCVIISDDGVFKITLALRDLKEMDEEYSRRVHEVKLVSFFGWRRWGRRGGLLALWVVRSHPPTK